ncbi:MAG: hypothetical protein JWM87_2009 [Candidatus Eremiobacteraeota bacterium]|nr:hypothetical protein [Candidatus Eremiobacteraeota bacterium]
MIRRTFSLLAFAALATGTGCNGGGTSPPPFPTGRALLPQHLYVGGSHGVAQFNIPLTSASTANFTAMSGYEYSIAVDADANLVVSTGASLAFFRAPLSGASTPNTVLTTGRPEYQLAFADSHDLWIADGLGGVRTLKFPFSSADLPPAAIGNAAIVGASGIAFDGAQNLYVVNDQNNQGFRGARNSNLLVYAPPYTGSPIATPNVPTSYAGVAVSATQLFVACLNRFDVYDLPITSTSSPAFSIFIGNSAPLLAVDAGGNLYAGNFTAQTIAVYPLPLSAASKPTVTLQLDHTFGLNTFAIGR